MYARLGFSVAAHLDPEILLIDEVLSVGDFAFQHKGIEKMKSIAQSGATVMFVSHNLRSMQQLCRRALLLDHGRLVADGPTEDITKSYLEAGRSSLLTKRDENAPAVIESVTLSRAAGAHRRARIRRELFRRGRRALQARLPRKRHPDLASTTTRASRPPTSRCAAWAGTTPTCAPGSDHASRFRADAHFVAGGYELLVSVRDNARGRDVATLDPPLQFMVQSDAGSRGIVHIQPELESVEVGGAG